MREVAGLGDRALHGAFPMLEQGVEVVDERLDLGWVFAVDAPVLSLVQPGQTRPEVVDWRQPAADLQTPKAMQSAAVSSVRGACSHACRLRLKPIA